MHQGRTPPSPQDAVAVDTLPDAGSASSSAEVHVHAPRAHDTEEDDCIPDGLLVEKSCVHEKGKTGGGFFQRLVGHGHGSKQQKYHVGNSFDLDTIATIAAGPSLPDADTFHDISASPAASHVAESAGPTAPTAAADAEILEDIPLDKTDLEAEVEAEADNSRKQRSPRDEELVAPQVVIHESPQKPLQDTSTVGYRHPILHKQSSSSESETPTSQYVLLTVVSASNLLKVHKFGVQAPYLEMKISSDDTSFRTAEYKKGGTEAHWNQTFTRRIASVEDTLHIAAKASTTVIGEVNVSFRALELSSTLSNHTLQLLRGKSTEPVGQISLQMRLLDSASSAMTATPSPVAPLPPLPIPPIHDNPVKPEVSLSKVKYNDVSDAANAPWDAAVRKGSLMFKIPYHQSTSSTPKRKWIVVQDLPKKGLCITWSDPQKPEANASSHFISLQDVVEVKTGIKTQAFRKQHAAQGKAATFFHEDVCFSLIAASRSLDLAASSKEEAALWVSSLRRLLQHQTAKPDAHTTTQILTSAKIMKDFKNAATSSEKTNHNVWIKELFRCAKSQNLAEIAQFLMDGCPVDLLEPTTGDTILFIACRSGHVGLLELCLKWGAKNDPHPTFGDTALQIAVKASQPECVRQLLSIAAKSDMDTEIVNHVDHENQAPLHVAATNGDIVCLQLLLHHGADICVVESHGHTPLHCAVLAGHEACVAYILDVGGDAIINTGDANGNTPLHCAVSISHEGLVKLLLESAADVTVTNNDQLTPYKMARRTKARAIQALLAIYEPEPPTPSKDTAMWSSPPHSARVQVRDALVKQMSPSPAKSASARSSSTTFDGDYDGYTSSSSTTTSIGETTNGSYYHTDYNHYPAYTQSSYPTPPSQHYPTYAYSHIPTPPPQQPPWSLEWQVKYTQDGHAYYVNLYTGVSQWELPPAMHGFDPYAHHSTQNSHAHQSYESPSIPAAPVYDSSSHYIRAQLAAARSLQAQNATPIVHTNSNPHQPATQTNVIPAAITTSATASPASSPRSKLGFSERRGLGGLKIETIPTSAPIAVPSETGAGAGLNLALKLNDDADIFQKSRSRSPKGKSKTVKVLDIKRANNIVMTLSDFEFNTNFDKIMQAIIDMDDDIMSLEKVRCLIGLFPTDEEKENLLARQVDKGEFGKAEKFMMACLEVDDIHARADCFLFKLKFAKTMGQLKTRVTLVVSICQTILESQALCSLLQQMLDDKKQKVMWEEDRYKQTLNDGLTSGTITSSQIATLKKLHNLPDLSCLQRSELQENLDTVLNGCRACQNLLSKSRAQSKADSPQGPTMSPAAITELERFIKSSVGEINDINEDFRVCKSWETKLVSEFGVVLEDFNAHEIFSVVQQLV